MTVVPVSEERPRRSPRFAFGLSLVLVALVPLWALPSWPAIGDAQVRLTLFDIPFAAQAALWLPWLCRRYRQRSCDREPQAAAVLLALLVPALLLVALAAHPSRWGLLAVVRASGAVALFLALRGETERRRVRALAGTLLVAGLAETTIAIAQFATGRPLGLAVLGELQDPLLSVGSAVAPRGTLQHSHPLGGFAVVAAFACLALLPWLGRRAAIASALVLVAFPIGVTYMRAAVIGVAAGSVTMLAARRGERVVRFGVAAITGGVLIAAAFGAGGWQARVRDGTAAATGGNADLLSNYRVSLTRGAVELARSHPLAGVGLGNYVAGSKLAAKASPALPSEIVHNLPLFVAVEAGIPAGLLILVLLLVVGLRAARWSLAALSVYLAFLPFIVFDRFAYDGPQGLAMTAIWLAAVELLINLQRGDHNRRRSPAEPNTDER